MPRPPRHTPPNRVLPQVRSPAAPRPTPIRPRRSPESHRRTHPAQPPNTLVSTGVSPPSRPDTRPTTTTGSGRAPKITPHPPRRPFEDGSLLSHSQRAPAIRAPMRPADNSSLSDDSKPHSIRGRFRTRPAHARPTRGPRQPARGTRAHPSTAQTTRRSNQSKGQDRLTTHRHPTRPRRRPSRRAANPASDHPVRTPGTPAPPTAPRRPRIPRSPPGRHRPPTGHLPGELGDLLLGVGFVPPSRTHHPPGQLVISKSDIGLDLPQSTR
ncbi:hypothetical protein CLV40_1146 [Actinokineospora auranticolor]|uniref:Uncharacterized protein n=1 Tax=Actinokineospora auranticolor TaxID=155976 RepID=A0A2S6GJE3_9PSEU|nr:hypothetical protein CLV40_1146 [Actinokineospora auranticolor]